MKKWEFHSREVKQPYGWLTYVGSTTNSIVAFGGEKIWAAVTAVIVVGRSIQPEGVAHRVRNENATTSGSEHPDSYASSGKEPYSGRGFRLFCVRLHLNCTTTEAEESDSLNHLPSPRFFPAAVKMVMMKVGKSPGPSLRSRNGNGFCTCMSHHQGSHVLLCADRNRLILHGKIKLLNKVKT